MEDALIVDDEPAVLKGLRTCIDWAGLNLRICGEAKNGRQALELVRELRPAVVIADVRMPFMNGIELARNIQAEPGDTKIILISAYADLDQMRSGYKLDAVDYVLKPIQVDELEAAVTRALDKREREKRGKELLREKFLVELIAGLHSRSTSLQERTRWLEIDLPLACPYLTCVVVPAEEPSDPAARELLLMSAGELIRGRLRDSFGGVVFRSLAGELVCLIPVGTDRSEFVDDLDGFLDWLPPAFEEEGLGRIWIGVGSEARGLSQTAVGYDSARIALEQRFFDSRQSVFYADFEESEAADRPSVHPEDLESIRHAISAGAVESLRAVIVELVDRAVASGVREASLIRSLGFRLVIEAADTLMGLGETGSAVAVDTYAAWRAVEKQESVESFKASILEYLLGVCRKIDEGRRTHSQVLVDRIRTFVGEQYNRPISISHIAESLEYTDSHICNVFKKHTGMTINTYLTRVRLEKASELLRNHTLRLYEICDRVGYGDYKHFVSLFKRKFGITPSEYRDRLIYTRDE